jgi:hypothetical protein
VVTTEANTGRSGRRFACPELASIAADSGFAAERVWRAHGPPSGQAASAPAVSLVAAPWLSNKRAARAAAYRLAFGQRGCVAHERSKKQFVRSDRSA